MMNEAGIFLKHPAKPCGRWLILIAFACGIVAGICWLCRRSRHGAGLRLAAAQIGSQLRGQSLLTALGRFAAGVFRVVRHGVSIASGPLRDKHAQLCLTSGRDAANSAPLQDADVLCRITRRAAVAQW